MAREKTPPTVTIKKRAPRKAASTAAARPKAAARAPAAFVGPGQRTELIAKAAYFRAQGRGFAPGHETEDWIAAESEVDAKLLRGGAGLTDLN